MSCKQCRFEFCWLCLTPSKDHSHVRWEEFCFLRNLIQKILFVILALIVKFKVAYSYQIILHYESLLFYNATAFLYANFIISTIYGYYYIYKRIKHLKNMPSDMRFGDYEVWKQLGLFLALIVIITVQVDFVTEIQELQPIYVRQLSIIVCEVVFAITYYLLKGILSLTKVITRVSMKNFNILSCYNEDDFSSFDD